jgi:sporulation-control protein
VVFKRLLGAFGVGAPSVDTVLATPRVRPGDVMRGEVRLKGGDFDADVEYIALGLVTKVEAEHGEGEQTGLIEFLRTEVSGPFRLAAGEERVLPFTFPVPWEAPVTEVQGRPLYGMAMGVRTELAIAKAVDKGDLDAVQIEPLPSQDAVLQAFSRLGFQFKGADLEMGGIYGIDQRLPFYQEIEFFPPPAHSHLVNEVELTFVANPGGLDIVLEADGHHSGDSFGRWRVSHEEAMHRDWAAEITGWLNALAQHGGHYGPGGYGPDGHGPGGYGHEGYGPGGYGHHDPHYGHHGHPGHPGHHGGPGMGTVVAAGAAGVVGGFLAAEAIDEIGDMFEGDED